MCDTIFPTHLKEPAPMSTSVRLADRDDLLTLVALMREFYAEAGFELDAGAAASAFGTLLDQPQLGRIWLADSDGATCGYLVLTIGYSMEFGGLRGYVDDFFVRPAARGNGVGTAILDAVRLNSTKAGIRALIVETGLQGHPARNLYMRAGFRDSGRALLSQALAPPLHEA
jgi:GNAT superfamily N-acetyltransferase